MNSSLRILFLSACFFLTLPDVVAQERMSDRLIERATRLMDAGLFSESEELLQSVLEAEPQHEVARYELAYLCYMQEEFRKCVQLVEGILRDNPRFADEAYQLLGNAYDRMGKRKKALSAYKTGLTWFPDSGKLHYEQGVVAFNDKDFLAALAHFENGIVAEPEYPSNYYGASTLFLVSDQPLWGIFYGELFMNLERGSNRTEAMSGYLYGSYKKCIEYDYNGGKPNMSLSFCDVTLSDLSAALPYEAVCEVMLGAAFPEDARQVDLEAIVRMRTGFLERMQVAEDMDEEALAILGGAMRGMDKPNVLLDYQRTVAREGHLDAYHHWVLQNGAQEEFVAWRSAHENEWNAFIEWFVENPLQVDKQHYFHRNLFQ